MLTTLGIFDEDFLLFTRIGVGILVAQTHTRLHLIDVLSTCTAASKQVPRHLSGVYIHLDGVVYQGRHEDAGKARHPFSLSVVGRNAHQSVHAIFAFKISIGIFSALDFHRYALDSGLVAFLKVTHRHAMSMSFGPAHIHSHEHLRPILTLCAACARIDFKHTVHRVFFLTQHIHEFQALDSLDGLSIIVVNLFLCHHFVFVEVESQLQFVGCLAHISIACNPFFDALHLLHLLLCTGRVIPKVGCLSAQLLLFELHFLLVNIQIAMQSLCSLLYVFELFCCNHC